MLDIQHISKTFNVGTVNEKRAVTDLSLHLEKGDFVTVIGSNGAGKSTLFNAIAGSFYVDEGRILLNGKDITFTREHDRSRVIGRLFQDPLRGTAPHMSIEENLALAYLRAAHGNPFQPHHGEATSELFRRPARAARHGAGGPAGPARRPALGWSAAGADAFDGDDGAAGAAAARRAHGGARPGTAEKVLALTQSIVAEHHITCHDGDAQHDAGALRSATAR